MTARSLIEVANFMVLQHNVFETMSPAVEAVSKQFPNIPEPLLTALWIGINAKQNQFSECSDYDDIKKYIRQRNKGQLPWEQDN